MDTKFNKLSMILIYICAVLFAIAAFFIFWMASVYFGETHIIVMGLIGTIIGISNLLTIYGLLKMKKWGKNLGVILIFINVIFGSIFHMVGFVLFGLLGLIILCLLLIARNSFKQ